MSRSRPITVASFCVNVARTLREKIFRVYNGLDLASLTEAKIASRAGAGVSILSVGRLVPFKGFEILIDACAELKRSKVEFRCEIVGDGPLREKLASRIAELNLASQVRLCGSLSQAEVYEKLQGCDLFALASVVDDQGASDVFPTVILEAMKCGKPVVSTHVAGIPEAVAEGQQGSWLRRIIPASSPRRLDKLIGDPALRKKMGAAGRERLEGNFTIQKTIEPLEEQFRSRLASEPNESASHAEKQKQIAYLVERWPDDSLPLLADELRALQRGGVPHLVFVLASANRVRAAG